MGDGTGTPPYLTTLLTIHYLDRYLRFLLILALVIGALCIGRFVAYSYDYVTARRQVNELMSDLERELPSV